MSRGPRKGPYSQRARRILIRATKNAMLGTQQVTDEFLTRLRRYFQDDLRYVGVRELPWGSEYLVQMRKSVWLNTVYGIASRQFYWDNAIHCANVHRQGCEGFRTVLGAFVVPHNHK